MSQRAPTWREPATVNVAPLAVPFTSTTDSVFSGLLLTRQS